MNLNGQQQIIQVQPGMVKVIRDVNGLEILHIKRFEDNVYSVHAIQEHLMVLFDGKHAQIFGSPLLRARSIGLCGDLNAETTAELKTPERCIMSQPRFAAYSFMIQESAKASPAKIWPNTKKKKPNVLSKKLFPPSCNKLTNTKKKKPNVLSKKLF